MTLRRSLSIEALRDLGRLDPEAIAQVRSEAWPLVRDADELHDVLLSQGALPRAEAASWQRLSSSSCARRAGRRWWNDRTRPRCGSATERWPLVRAVWPDAVARPRCRVPAGVRTRLAARGSHRSPGPRPDRMRRARPRSTDRRRRSGWIASDVEIGLLALEKQGLVLRGRFTGAARAGVVRPPAAGAHSSLDARRPAPADRPGVRPSSSCASWSGHQHLHRRRSFAARRGCWRSSSNSKVRGAGRPLGEVPAAGAARGVRSRLARRLTFFGQAAWGRLRPLVRTHQAGRAQRPADEGPDALDADHADAPRPRLLAAAAATSNCPKARCSISSAATPSAAYEAFAAPRRLVSRSARPLLQLVPAQVDDVLGELAAAGLVTSDGYPALRTLLGVRTRTTRHRRRRCVAPVVAARRPLDALAFAVAAPGRRMRTHRALVPAAAAALRRHVPRFAGQRIRGAALGRTGAHLSAAGSTRRDPRRPLRRRRGRRAIRLARGDPAAPRRPATSSPAWSLPATDPLNLTGRIMAGARVPALPGHSIAIVNGCCQTATGLTEGTHARRQRSPIRFVTVMRPA